MSKAGRVHFFYLTAIETNMGMEGKWKTLRLRGMFEEMSYIYTFRSRCEVVV